MKITATLALVMLCVACQSPTPSPPPTKIRATPLLSPLEEVEDLDPAEGVIHARLRAEARAEGPFRYAYNGLNPGPLIRGKVGDRLIVELDNGLDQGTTIHWHGLKVPFEMDGVPWMGAPVGAGESFRYEFDLPHAGTYWYHPHFNTEGQVDGGLYGALIIEDPNEPRADEALILIFDTESEHDPDRAEGRAPGHAHGHGRLKPVWRINGQPAPVEVRPKGGATVRVRMINASNAAYLDLRWPGIRQIASDQGLFEALHEPDRIVMGPGDRAEAEWLIGEAGFDVETWPWSLNGGEALGAPEVLLKVAVEDPLPAPAGLDWPFQGRAPTPDPGKLDILYALQGSDRTSKWLINGESFPEVTIETLAFGSEAFIEVRNLSPTEHPFHLHGLHFEVLSINGEPVARRMIEDTINLRIRDRVRLRVVADNAGDWMTHCHILPHAGDGMMTVLRVSAP